MSFRQTRFEEAILERALYSSPAAAIGAAVGLFDQTQQDARVDLATEYRGMERSFLKPFTGATQGLATSINAASVAAMPLHGSVFTTLNFAMLALSGNVINASMVNTQPCPVVSVGTGAVGSTAADAVLIMGAGSIQFGLPNGALSPACSEQSLLVIGDPTSSPRAVSPVLSKYLLLLAGRSAVLSENQFRSLARQLRALLSDLEEPSTLDGPRSVASFRGLIKFLTEKRPSHPSLSISKDGLFVASWSPKQRAELSLTFLDAEGGSWYALSLDDFLHSEGKFFTSSFSLPVPYGSWTMR
ncbi:hypothetical protein [Bradyrhizobium sp. B120]|uniref:hypothetical protein n=1 Tax=Bradyrhizobium sp. B120 TaxID=3410088 RepID=UPI003B9860D9